jgi:hypothetical protein
LHAPLDQFELFKLVLESLDDVVVQPLEVPINFFMMDLFNLLGVLDVL